MTFFEIILYKTIEINSMNKKQYNIQTKKEEEDFNEEKIHCISR